MGELSRTLVFIGIIFIGIGVLLGVAGKIPGIGRLPGDITIQRGNFSFFFPIATCFILSVVLTLILNLFGRR